MQKPPDLKSGVSTTKPATDKTLDRPQNAKKIKKQKGLLDYLRAWVLWFSNIFLSKKEKHRKSKRNDVELTESKKLFSENASLSDKDDEGYSLPPQESENDPKISSSLSNSDDESEDNEPVKEIHFEIKSDSMSSGSCIDELRESVKYISLSPISQPRVRRRATSNFDATCPPANKESLPGVDLFTLTRCQSPASTFEKINDKVFEEIDPENLCTLEKKLMPMSPEEATTEKSMPEVAPFPHRSLYHLLDSTTGTKIVENITCSKTDPLTLDSDVKPSCTTTDKDGTIPLGITIKETVQACFKETDENSCQVYVLGVVKVSFPSRIPSVVTNDPSLEKLYFQLLNPNRIDEIIPNEHLVKMDANMNTSEQYFYEFDMPALTSLLKKLYENTPTAVSFNVDILKYRIKAQPDVKSAPLHLIAYWRCDSDCIDLRIDYQLNPCALDSTVLLQNIHVFVPINGDFICEYAEPKVNRSKHDNMAVWRISDLSEVTDGCRPHSLMAKFHLTSGLAIPSIVAAKFVCEGTTFSAIDFELSGFGYHLASLKRLVIAGKYLCVGEEVTSSSTSDDYKNDSDTLQNCDAKAECHGNDLNTKCDSISKEEMNDIKQDRNGSAKDDLSILTPKGSFTSVLNPMSKENIENVQEGTSRDEHLPQNHPKNIPPKNNKKKKKKKKKSAFLTLFGIQKNVRNCGQVKTHNERHTNDP